LLGFIMARVEVKILREQAAHFGLYRTSAGGDASIIVRRKVGEPTDYLHSKSRKLIRQRENLALASQHYASLTPGQKADTRRQIDFIEYQKSHGKTDTKLLRGRQLFIAREMKALHTTGKRLLVPHEICIMLVDKFLNPLTGHLWLRYLDLDEWWNIDSRELCPANWLFMTVPPAQEAYRPYGEALGYYDPELPEHQFMTENELKLYHYHILLGEGAPAGADFSAAAVWHTDYDLVWEHPGQDTEDTYDTIRGSQHIGYNDMYQISRGCFVFDTTGILPTDTILSITFHFWIETMLGVEPGDLHFLKDPGVILPTIPENYGKLRLATHIIATMPKNQALIGDWNELPIPESEFGFINKGGYSALALRCQHDLTKTPNEYNGNRNVGWYIASGDHPEHQPYLDIVVE